MKSKSADLREKMNDSEKLQQETRKKKRKTFEVETAKMDMTPMIDCVFMLLIFFMCATKFKTIEDRFDANLPDTGGPSLSQPPIDEPEPLEIGILDDSQARFSADPVRKFSRSATFIVNAQRKIRSDHELLQVLRGIPPKTPVMVYPVNHGRNARSDQVPFGQVVRLLDICHQANVTNVRFRPPVAN